jgi:integrase
MPPSCTSRTHPPTQNRRPEAQEPDGLKIIQEQVGHQHASTTSIYTSVSGDFKNRILADAIQRLTREEEN